MEDDKFLTEALDVIESLLETISWLGGDPYEMDAVEKDVECARSFLTKHRPSIEVVDELAEYGESPWKPINGIYCLRSDHSVTVTANNKVSAAKKMKIGKEQLLCLTPPISAVEAYKKSLNQRPS